jgi:hypothetical protein
MYSKSAHERVESIRDMLRKVKKIKGANAVDLAALSRILRKRIAELEIESANTETHRDRAA